MKANMVYYQIYLFQSNTFVYHCVINQTLQDGQTLGQFFEPLYVPFQVRYGKVSLQGTVER
jgi:hypothetical protein